MESPCSLFRSWAMALDFLCDAHTKSVKAAKESLKDSNPACSLTFAHPTNHEFCECFAKILKRCLSLKVETLPCMRQI